jgi:molybdopterin synthase catalytic subunit
VTVVAITEEPIRVEEFLADLPSSSDGAMVLFLGVVRDHHQGRQVTGLVYEAYREMAEEMLRTIAAEVEERFGTDRIVAKHRIGALGIGEVATAIGIATPHRDKAYDASRYFIEEIKKRLPIWKQETYAGGEKRWLDGTVPPKHPREREEEQ